MPDRGRPPRPVLFVLCAGAGPGLPRYLSNMNGSVTAPVRALYAHVPFCARKCSYCAFYSHELAKEAGDRYVTALVREMEGLGATFGPVTVFFGGGTPSILSMKQWEVILRAMARLNFLGAHEWTVECNPATVSLEKARLLRSFGVNRVSMGVQSMNDSLLDRLGRIHTREMVFKSYDVLRSGGFDNINIDLMFAIPGQTLEIWRDTLDQAIAMQSEHLSCYEVIYEEDTPLFAQLQAGRFKVDEDLACDMYDELLARSSSAGFQQYEIANFAKAPHDLRRVEPLGFLPESDARWNPDLLPIPSRACLHNVNYWRGGAFFGVGPSATSYVSGERTRNWTNTDIYCGLIEQGRSAVEFSEKLTPLAKAGETAAFGMRMIAGWPFGQFKAITGYDLRDEWSADMTSLVERGWGERDDVGFRLTPAGLRFADSAAQFFLR